MNADASIVIRKCTLAPIVAALLMTFFYGTCPEIFGSFASLLWQLLLLTLFPLLAYPLAFLAKYRNHASAPLCNISLTNLHTASATPTKMNTAGIWTTAISYKFKVALSMWTFLGGNI